ncbi:MAG: flagellar protein FlaG [Colwellia sp.]|nr:flagellar protein FlaG [Colwellia sp.]
MSVIQNGIGRGVTGLALDSKRRDDTITKNKIVDNNEKKIITEGTLAKVNTVQESAEDIVTNQPITTKQLEKVAQQLQDFVGDLNRNIEFSVDKDSGRDVIKVTDKDTGDLLKQYPSEEVLTLVSKLSEMIGGFVDTKV